MIECEICGGYFDLDDIEKCPECDIEICGKCYDKHVNLCIAESNEMRDEEDEDDGDKIPYNCPECGSEWEFSCDYDGAFVLCTNDDCGHMIKMPEKTED